MSTMDSFQGNTSLSSHNEDSMGSVTKTVPPRKHHIQNFSNVHTPKAAAVIVTAVPAAPQVDERDKNSFYRDLYNFHENKGTPIPRVPRVNGREIDLHKFYSLVCSRGGWSKVNYRNEWEDLVSDFDLPVTCVNASVALKQIYIRFLDKYERVHFLGEDNDRNNDEVDEDNRHKKWSNKNLNEIPLKYNYNQHIVSESVRIANKLSTDLYRSSEYDRLMLSLMSPLPNEQDFAINVCTLMANESKHTLKIEHCPKLIDALLGHAGVYSHYTLRELFSEFYASIRNHPLQSFWSDCLAGKPEVLELSYDDYFQTVDDKAIDVIPNRPPMRLRADNGTFEDGLNVRPNERDDFTTVDFMNLSRGLGTHDYIGQRVSQVTSIFRNLSFMEENISTLVKNRSFIRFLVMTSNIRWGNLHQMALDMLGNVASELELWDPVTDDLTRSMLSLISDGVESPDRGVIISCLEILYKLCQKSSNEDYLHKCLNRRTYQQICLFLSLNDIMLLLYTLECLFALSSLGEKSCYHIVQIRGVIDTLVSLVSVEAQSYGPDGCILMRVVETVPTHLTGQSTFSPHSQQTHHHVHSNNPQYQQQFSPSNYTALQSSPPPMINHSIDTPIPPPEAHRILTVPPPIASPPPQPIQVYRNQVLQNVAGSASLPSQSTTSTIVTLATPTSSIVTNPALPVSIAATVTVATMANVAPATPTPVITGSIPAGVNVIKTEPTTHIGMSPVQSAIAAKHAQQQAVQENEQFALQWLRGTFEPAETLASRIEQQDLYKMYLTASSKIGRIGVVTQMHFPRCVRSVFGGTVGPNQVKIKQNNTETIGFYYQGIRIRAQPKPLTHKGTVLQASVTSTPLQGSDNVVKTECTTPVKGNVVTVKTMHQHLPNIQNQSQSILVAQLSGKNQGQTQQTATGPILQHVLSNQSGESNVVVVTHPSQNRPNVIQQNQVQNHPTTIPATTPSSLIKSLLANKVTTTDAFNAATTITTNVASSIIATPNVNVPQQVAQRQHLQKQKEAQQHHLLAASLGNDMKPVIQLPAGAQIKATTLHVNLPPTIKTSITTNTPIPATIIEKKPEIVHEKINWDAVPPLAPLSSGLHAAGIRQTNIVSSIQTKIEDDSSSISGTFSTLSGDDVDNAFAGFEGMLIPGKKDDDSKDGFNRQSQVVTSNKMLADLLDKKSPDPPFNIATGETSKRKRNSNDSEPVAKRSANEDAYNKLFASVLDDDELEEDVAEPVVAEPQKSVISVPMQRQIIVSPNSSPQVILAPTPANPPMGQATATIKTESGFQTVPVILQHGNPNPVTNLQIQKQIGGMGQQIMQPVIQQPQTQTQFMFATDQQGQRYLVAQQQPKPVNQILVTQTAQQQGGPPTQTIIISGGQILGAVNAPGTPQKVYLTTNQQGQQQMFVTQVQRPLQHHVIVNQHPSSSNAVIQSSATISNTTSIINQVATGTLPAINPQPQIVSQVQLQQSQTQLSLSAGGQIQHQTIQIQKHGQSYIQHSTGQQMTMQQHKISQSTTSVQTQQTVQMQTGQVQPQPVIQHTLLSQSQTHQQPNKLSQMPSPVIERKTDSPVEKKVFVTGSGNIEITEVTHSKPPSKPPTPAPTSLSPKKEEEPWDPNHLWVCDWRGCHGKKFRSANEVYLHACAVHCPDNIDPNAEIYCQWGPGPNLCDNLPRKRFSLMTHLLDRHCTAESFKAAISRRATSGPLTGQPAQPVTMIKNPAAVTTQSDNIAGTASPALSTSSSGSMGAGSAALQAIKRHTLDFTREMMDDNEGPVTKSIRLTAALILRNLVNYTSTAKRCLRYYEPHLASIALSNVESSRAIAQVLYEMNETRPY